LRLRVLHPAGLNEEVFELHGHAWQEEPYSKGSLRIVDHNPLSQWTGSRDTFGANASFDVVLKHAGGVNAVTGDYLFRTFIAKDFQSGMWGLVRVGEPGKDVLTVTTYCASANPTIAGVNTVNPLTNAMAPTVTITGTGLNTTRPVDPSTGRWSYTGTVPGTLPPITVTSTEGGTETTSELCPIQAVQPPIGTNAVDRFRLSPQAIPQTPPPPKRTQDVDRFRLKPPTLANPK
jgi:hypothetical protein